MRILIVVCCTFMVVSTILLSVRERRVSEATIIANQEIIIEQNDSIKAALLVAFPYHKRVRQHLITK